MTQKSLNRLRMLRSTAAQLESMKAVWSGNPMAQAEVARLRQLIADIETAHARTLSASGKEQREVTRSRRDAAIGAIMTLVNVTQSWAESVPEEQLLLQRIATRPYLLRRLTEAELIARLQELLAHCIAARPNIPGNPLGAEDYRNAQACLDIFLGMQDAGRRSDVDRQGENDNLHGLFRQSTPLLKRIDRLMENCKPGHPVDFAKYRASRSVYDYSNSHKKPGAAKSGSNATAPGEVKPHPGEVSRINPLDEGQVG